MTKYSKRNSLELSDQEAYDLLRSIRGGVDRRGNRVEIGRAFRESYKHFLLNGDSNSWEFPSTKYRLEIDQEIYKLTARDKDPSICQSKNSNSFALRHSNPYYLARVHLENFITTLRDPLEESDQAEVYLHFLDQINIAADTLMPILMKPWWEIGKRQASQERWGMDIRPGEPPKHTPTAANVIALQEQLETAFEALRKLGTIVEAEFPFMQIQKAATGRPRLLWRDHFVQCMAHLWRLLTGCEPSRDEKSLFADFVYAAWISLDENMPEVKFAHTIRNLPDETRM